MIDTRFSRSYVEWVSVDQHLDNCRVNVGGRANTRLNQACRIRDEEFPVDRAATRSTTPLAE